MATTSALELAQELAKQLDGKKADEISILDVSGKHSEIECFVIVTARADRHAKTLGEDALTFAKRRGLRGCHLEVASDWICGDFGEVVLHVFTPEARSFYDLEHLWGDAARVPFTPADSVPA